jgi:hypothetical protein
MDEVSVDGAIATATYFLQLFPYVANTGDLTDWDALSHPECRFCAGVRSEVDGMVALGQYQEGTEMSILSATASEVTPGIWFLVEITYTEGPWRVLDTAGRIIDAAAGATSMHGSFAVIREEDHWLIRAGQAVVTGV